MIFKLIKINLDIDINNDEFIDNHMGTKQERKLSLVMRNNVEPKIIWELQRAFFFFLVMGIFDQVLDGPKNRYVVIFSFGVVI